MQYVKCDVTSWEDQLAAFKAAITKSPTASVDIVVANAGVSGSDEFFEGIPQEPFRFQLSVLGCDH